MHNFHAQALNSPLENYKVIFRRSTPKGGGGLNLVIAECSPLKTKSIRRSREIVKLMRSAEFLIMNPEKPNEA